MGVRSPVAPFAVLPSSVKWIVLALDVNDPKYLQQPLVIDHTDVTLQVTAPAAVAPGGTAHIVAHASRASDQKPAPGFLRLYKANQWSAPTFQGVGYVDGNTGNGSLDLVITPDIPPGRHVLYLACLALNTGPYASSALVPVTIDVRGR